VFQTVFVFPPASATETWDEHLAAFIAANPQFGPPTCLDGTGSPCLQGLTSKAIDNAVQALFASNYFQAMGNSYGIGIPSFAGEQALNGVCAPPPAATTASSLSWLDVANLASCQFGLTPNAPRQTIMVFSPDLPPSSNITQPPMCTAASNNTTAFHSAVPSGINIQKYLTDPPFVSGFQQCLLESTSPLGLFETGNQCLASSIGSSCLAAALGGAVVCPVFDPIFPFACEIADALYVSSCTAAAGTATLADATIGALEASKVSFAVIPTTPSCIAETNYSRPIIGGGAMPAVQGGVRTALDDVLVQISHETAETITDPAALGWVHPSSDVLGQYDTGEIGDICEKQANDPLPLTPSIFMPFLSLHVARYWSNADQKCMPQFDMTNTFSYQYGPLCPQLAPGLCQPWSVLPTTPMGVDASVSNATPLPNGFWGTAMSQSPSNQPNVRLTQISTMPATQLGNSLDNGAHDAPLSYSATLTPGGFEDITPNTGGPIPPVLELWDSLTGQGAINATNPNQAANWPPPTGCVLVAQPPINQPANCTATVTVETQAYGLPQSPVGGTPTYSVSPGSVAPNHNCDAITPCTLLITKSSGSGPATLSVTDVVAPPVGNVGNGRPRWTSRNNVTLKCSTTVNFDFGGGGGPPCLGSSANLTVAVLGGGNVVGAGSTGSNINCSNTGLSSRTEFGTCTATYASGSSATLTATPASGFVFQMWTNCSSGSPLCSLNVSGSPTVTAVFKPMSTP
jgi:hypothetical protein